MSVEMWNCLFWPLSASYIHICIVVDLAIKLIYCSNDGGYICLLSLMTTLNSEEITLSSDSAEWGYICLWVSMNIEQWRDHSVLCYCWLGGGISAFECQWQHWTVKRSLCPLLNWPRGDICLWVSMTTLNSEKITLSSDSVEWGEGVYLLLSLNDNIKQWRDHSVHCYCYPGGISAFESQWQHWAVKRSLCPLIVLTRGYICLWVSMTTLNSKEITLSSANVDQGGISAFECQWQHWTVKRSLCPQLKLTKGRYLPFSVNDNIEQWRDHSVHCYCYEGGISAFECQWQHWTVKRSLCSQLKLTRGGYLPVSVNDNIEQ